MSPADDPRLPGARQARTVPPARTAAHPGDQSPPGRGRPEQTRRTPGRTAEQPGTAGLLDEALTAALGPVDAPTAEAITGICDDAIGSVLGPALAGMIRADPRLLPLIAPWARDLARGLQFQSHCGPGQPPTAGLLTRLAARPLTDEEVRRFAETADLAAVLTLDRLLEQVLGPGACGRDPAVNEAAAPWLAGLQLGYRIHLVLELLRLSAPG